MPPSDTLCAAAEKVVSKRDFLDFLRDLAESCAGDPQAWENDTLRAYLEGLRGYVQDTPEPAPGGEPGDGVSWRRLAEMLLAARVYD